MTNSQSDAEVLAQTLYEFHAPERDLIARVRKMEASYKEQFDYIRQHRPDEQAGNFPSLADLETKNAVELEFLKVSCNAALIVIYERAERVEAEVEAAERIRAEQNMTEMEALKRAYYQLATRVAKLESERTGRLPGLPHIARAEVPQFQGMPAGLGRHGIGPSGNSGVRKIGSNGSAADPDTSGPGFTRRAHPLNAITGSDNR